MNPSITERINAFLDHCDENGVSNSQKIYERQRIIRRVASTDKNKSYEEGASSNHSGIVIEDGKLIGIGIHIFNEDIYPLQSFEIYLRGCNLTGILDLSNCEDLLFVDLYHNRITGVELKNLPKLRILGLQDNRLMELYPGELPACQGIDAGKNRLSSLDVSHNQELVELYVNDNCLTRIDLRGNPKLKYFYCHNNTISELDTRANPLLRHLNATGNPMKRILSLAPQRDEALPLELVAEEGGAVGLIFNPVYNAQWKETGEWQQSYYAYPDEGWRFKGWYDASGAVLSENEVWIDTYGASRQLTAKFER